MYYVLGMEVGKTLEYLCQKVSHFLQRHRGEGASSSHPPLIVDFTEAAVAQLHGNSENLGLSDLKDSISVDQVGMPLLQSFPYDTQFAFGITYTLWK